MTSGWGLAGGWVSPKALRAIAAPPAANAPASNSLRENGMSVPSCSDGGAGKGVARQSAVNNAAGRLPRRHPRAPWPGRAARQGLIIGPDYDWAALGGGPTEAADGLRPRFGERQDHARGRGTMGAGMDSWPNLIAAGGHRTMTRIGHYPSCRWRLIEYG